MELTQSERIQILRKRTGLNQGDFGSRAFKTSFESGRTKMKNIELGKQAPTAKDLVRIAALLDLPESELNAPTKAVDEPGPSGRGVWVEEAVLARFPGMDTYLDMLNKAVALDDQELIDYISAKVAALLTSRSPMEALAAG